MLHHVADDVQSFGDVQLLDSSPFEHSNTKIKRFIKMISRRRWSDLEEAKWAMNSLIGYDKCSPVKHQKTWTAQLVWNGMKIVFGDILSANANAFVHTDRDSRSVLVLQIFENVKECFNLTFTEPLPYFVVLKMEKLDFFYVATKTRLDHFDPNNRCSDKNIVF